MSSSVNERLGFSQIGYFLRRQNDQIIVTNGVIHAKKQNEIHSLTLHDILFKESLSSLLLFLSVNPSEVVGQGKTK